MYIKSVYTGQVYKVAELPKFGGYEIVDREAYIAWCKSIGLKPEDE